MAPYDVVVAAVAQAVERGMNRCDKYSNHALTESQRGLLRNEIEQSFWMALEDANVDLC